MSDSIQNPNQGEAASSNEYGFDRERDVLEKDEVQAEASEYGLYGYADEPGQSFYEQAEVHARGEESEATAAARRAGEAPPEEKEQGGQEWHETSHGAGFAQPMEEPQRRASHSERPSDEQ